MKAPSKLIPLLVVRGAPRAIDFYVRALGAEVLVCHEHGAERHVSHADLAVAGTIFSVTEEAHTWNSDAPPSLGGSPVVLQLLVDDVAAVLGAMQAAGATVVFPLQELLGARMARVRDPFGHLWILQQQLEELSVAELQRQRHELFARAKGAASERALVSFEATASLSDALGLPQQATEPAAISAGKPRPSHVHLVAGPVGAGKTTYAIGLARDQRAVRLDLDQWMAKLFRQDRPETEVMAWYRERAERCRAQIWTIVQQMAEVGTDVVLELGLLKRCDREQFYERVVGAGLGLTIYALDAARDVRRQRVRERNRAQGVTFSMRVPAEVFELASDLWEPLEPGEGEAYSVRMIRTDAP